MYILTLIIFSVLFFTLVGSLPTTYQSSFGGATAVTSATLDGAYVQHEEHLYELQCKFNFAYLNHFYT